MDYVLLPGSKKPRELYERTLPLWYQQTTPLPEGFPKNDALFERIEGEAIGCDVDLIEDVEHRSATETVVIYAPTNLKDEPNPLVDSDSNLHCVDSFLDETDAHLYIKLHPKNYQRSLGIDVELSNITVLADSMDLYPFLRSCDIFISDYTTSILDIHLLDIPVIYFPYDLQEEGPDGAFDEYGYTRRGSLAIDYSELHGGYTVADTDELIDAVRLYLDDPSEFSEQRDRVRDMYFDYPDGNSSERVCEFFLSHSDD